MEEMKITKSIDLPCYNIRVAIYENGAGTITSDLFKDLDDNFDEVDSQLESSIEAITSLILAHACAGVNIGSLGYIEGIETTIEAILNEYG